MHTPPLPYTMKKIGICLLMLVASFTCLAAPTLHDLDGKKIKLSSLKGNWVFINYWASWCHPCLEEIPELNRFYERYKMNNVVVYGVNYDALPISQQKELVRELGIKYPNLKEDPNRILKLGDIRGVPVTFIFNPEGRLERKLYGPQTIRSLRSAIR